IQDGGVFTDARNRGWPHFDVEGTNFSFFKVLRMKLGRRVKCQREGDSYRRWIAESSALAEPIRSSISMRWLTATLQKGLRTFRLRASEDTSRFSKTSSNPTSRRALSKLLARVSS